MGHNGLHRQPADPLTTLTQGVMRMSSLRLDDITRGFQNFANPSARGMLESMGRTRDQQVKTMVAMLRNSSEADVEEMGQVFALAMAQLAEERAGAPVGRSAAERPPRRRHQSAAERRRQRRLVS
jgi:hypothetical protein